MPWWGWLGTGVVVGVGGLLGVAAWYFNRGSDHIC
jgi:hypothetical protein